MRAYEYHLNGRLKRVEFHSPWPRIAGLYSGAMQAGKDFDAPLCLLELSEVGLVSYTTDLAPREE